MPLSPGFGQEPFGVTPFGGTSISAYVPPSTYPSQFRDDGRNADHIAGEILWHKAGQKKHG